MTNEEAKDYIREWCPYDRQEEIIKALEQEPKTGHWIDHEKHIECDSCSVWFLKDHLIRKSFCPNCGAKMQEVEE